MRFSKSEYEEAFECDGSLRDLYILPTSLNDWHDFVRFVNSTHYPVSFHINGEPAATPLDATLPFSIRPDASPLLQIDVRGVTLNCHFFHERDIELDIDPRQVTDDAKADAVLAFMAELGGALKREVVMTAENAPDAVILRYDPTTERVAYDPPPFES